MQTQLFPGMLTRKFLTSLKQLKITISYRDDSTVRLVFILVTIRVYQDPILQSSSASSTPLLDIGQREPQRLFLIKKIEFEFESGLSASYTGPNHLYGEI